MGAAVIWEHGTPRKIGEADEGAGASSTERQGTLNGRAPLRAAFIRAMSITTADIDSENAGRVKGVDDKAGEHGEHQRNHRSENEALHTWGGYNLMLPSSATVATLVSFSV